MLRRWRLEFQNHLTVLDGDILNLLEGCLQFGVVVYRLGEVLAFYPGGEFGWKILAVHDEVGDGYGQRPVRYTNT